MKKVFTVCLTLFLFLTLAGCGQMQTNEQNEEPVTAPQEEQGDLGIAEDKTEPVPPEQEETAQAVQATVEHREKWYNEKLPYDEIELFPDGTYVSTLFDRGTYHLEGETVVFDNDGTEYEFVVSQDGQELSYDNLCYIKTQFPVPEYVIEGYGREGIYTHISYDECDHADIVTVNEIGEEIPTLDKGARALIFGGVVQDLNTYPWYAGDDVLIFGGFYADNGFVSSITKKYTPFKIVSIKSFPVEESGAVSIFQNELIVKTEDGLTHTIRKQSEVTDATRECHTTLSSDLFEGHVFQMNNWVGSKEPEIWS